MQLYCSQTSQSCYLVWKKNSTEVRLTAANASLPNQLLVCISLYASKYYFTLSHWNILVWNSEAKMKTQTMYMHVKMHENECAAFCEKRLLGVTFGCLVCSWRSSQDADSVYWLSFFGRLLSNSLRHWWIVWRHICGVVTPSFCTIVKQAGWWLGIFSQSRFVVRGSYFVHRRMRLDVHSCLLSTVSLLYFQAS